jgi:hypothetical protein
MITDRMMNLQDILKARLKISLIELYNNIIMKKLTHCGRLKESLKATLLIAITFELATFTMGKPREYNQCDGPWSNEIL